MAGIVYLKTNRFEVKLEGITFKKKNFESLCKIDFLFPDGKDWDGPPVVGLDVMPHPRDPSIILLLLCFGVGCVILRFSAGEALPAPIHRFLADKRIRFVSFGIPEKMELFPFEELGLRKREVDVGYLAAKVFKDPKYKRYGLGELARKVLGIKRMTGLTEASSFERHAPIKCAICQLFVTSVIAMGLFGANEKKKLDYSSKKNSFLKNLNSLHLLAEGWFKLPKSKKKNEEEADDKVHACKMEEMLDDGNNLVEQENPFVDYLVDSGIQNAGSGDYSNDYSNLAQFGDYDAFSDREIDDDDDEKGEKEEGDSSDDCRKKSSSPTAPKPIKGILKCPSRTLNRCGSSRPATTPPSPSPWPSPSPSNMDARSTLRRANSKGYNVSFKFLDD